ncbi:hypothetical protein PI125_g6143 [Phytophthora idaei]|nr:hypothetical protein PI125_g6143 [Phytophthora idaei]KAG3162557.1 hypothetical protein PI126_g5920 [Phytophthora idaei]
MRNAEATIIPQATRSQIRQANGTQVCIHFQAASGCSFPRCRHAHKMRQLPPDVFRTTGAPEAALSVSDAASYACPATPLAPGAPAMMPAVPGTTSYTCSATPLAPGATTVVVANTSIVPVVTYAHCCLRRRGHQMDSGRSAYAWVVPPWINPAGRCGVRPVLDNYVGADTGASIVTDKLLTDYYKGRCLVAPMDILTSDPGFHSNSFELIPKKGQPLRVDGRTIHACSVLPGQSVNDQTDSSASLDAT